jgi:hypothetical protein
MARKKGPRKLTYQTKGNVYPRITLSGVIWLKYVDDEADGFAPKLGDLLLYIHVTSNTLDEPWDYERLGRSGYLKAELFDGYGFKPFSLEECFDDREYYFSKTERPIDRVNLCRDHLSTLKGRQAMRLYREHYVLAVEK